jgi:hypothetical protein
MKVWQFFEVKRLAELQDKENDEFVRRANLAANYEYIQPEKKEDRYIFLNEEDQAEKVLLLKTGQERERVVVVGCLVERNLMLLFFFEIGLKSTQHY